LYHNLSKLLVPEWILKSEFFLFHQELPERLLLTYKPEESEEVTEPVPAVEEEQQIIEEPAPVPSSSEAVSTPSKASVTDTGDLLVSKKNSHRLNVTVMHFSQSECHIFS